MTDQRRLSIYARGISHTNPASRAYLMYPAPFLGMITDLDCSPAADHQRAVIVDVRRDPVTGCPVGKRFKSSRITTEVFPWT